MLASVARMIDAASRSFAPLERVTRSMVHTDPTVAKSTGANIRIRVGAIDDGLRGRECSRDELICHPTPDGQMKPLLLACDSLCCTSVPKRWFDIGYKVCCHDTWWRLHGSRAAKIVHRGGGFRRVICSGVSNLVNLRPCPASQRRPCASLILHRHQGLWPFGHRVPGKFGLTRFSAAV